MRKGELVDDPSFVVATRIARARLQLLSGELASAIEHLSASRTLADHIGHATGRSLSRCLLVAAYGESGNHTAAETSASEVVSLCEPFGMRFFPDWATAFLATSRLDAGRIAEAIALLSPLVERSDRLLCTYARSRLSLAFIVSGDFESAAHEAQSAFDQGSNFSSIHPAIFGVLARIALKRGQPAEALMLVERGLDAEPGGRSLRDGSILRLARAVALFELGRPADANLAIREARDRILCIAATLDDPSRLSYLTRIEANARTLDLAREWLAENRA